MRWWADDADFYSDSEIGTLDVFVFGGIAVREGHAAELIANVEAIKAKHGHPRAPIKWNFKDAEKFYSGSDKRKEIYAQMSKTCPEWRAEIFDVLGTSGVTLIVTAIEAYSNDKDKILAVRANCAQHVFANALMRYGLHAQEVGENADVVIDWPAANERQPFNDEYQSAYSTGKTCGGHKYRSGELYKLGFSDSVLFSTTQHSCMLQLADLVVGASRDFLRATLLAKKYGPGFDMLKRIKDRFRGAPNKVSSHGLNVSTGNGAFREAVGKAIFHDLFGNPRPKVAAATSDKPLPF
jgi:hypothetical protein